MIAANAMEGPNGTGVFLPCPRTRKMTIPTISPMTAARNNVNNTFHVPRTSPIKKNNFISPPPIPPRDRAAIQNNMPKPMTAPSILSHQGVNGDTIRPMKSNGKKNNNTLSGINIYVISDTTMMTRSEMNKIATTNSTVNPNWEYANANKIPVASSIKG